MENITTVIFDVGRVLVDIDPNREKFAGLMRSMGISPDEAFSRFWYVNEVRRHMTGELDSPGFYRFLRNRFNLGLDYEEFAEAWCDLFRPIDGMEDIFRRVAARFRVGVLSDTDPLHWRRVRELLPFLEKVAKPTLSFNVGRLKPHPEMFLAAASDCGTDTWSCLFIDDVLANVDGARLAGMPALHFTGADKLARGLAFTGILS